MSASVISVRDGASSLLDAKRGADEVVAPGDAADSSKLARLLTQALADIAALRRRFAPQRITFRDIVSTGTADTPVTVRLPHRFGGPVEWWVVGVKLAGTVVVPLVMEAPASDADTLVVQVYFPATLAIRVEETG